MSDCERRKLLQGIVNMLSNLEGYANPHIEYFSGTHDFRTREQQIEKTKRDIEDDLREAKINLSESQKVALFNERTQQSPSKEDIKTANETLNTLFDALMAATRSCYSQDIRERGEIPTEPEYVIRREIE